MIDTYKLTDGFDVEHFPNTAEYIKLHGIMCCMSKWDLKPPYNTCEEVYADCLKKGIKWEELLGFDGYEKDVLL